jgi:hypothetical protein
MWFMKIFQVKLIIMTSNTKLNYSEGFREISRFNYHFTDQYQSFAGVDSYFLQKLLTRRLEYPHNTLIQKNSSKRNRAQIQMT